MEKYINLSTLCDIGRATAIVRDNSVEIQTSGISGGLKAWLIGNEAVPIGNIVDGRLRKEIDTTKHTGILITQSGRQLFIGRYAEGENTASKEETPFDKMGFDWQKITGKSFEKTEGYIRFILSNKKVYENYKRHRHYWLGESECANALALRYENEEELPVEFTDKPRLYKNGYAIICVDKKTGRLYIPEEKR